MIEIYVFFAEIILLFVKTIPKEKYYVQKYYDEKSLALLKKDVHTVRQQC